MSGLTVEPVTSFRVRRLTVPFPGARTFQARYERAVPNLPLDRVKELVASGAPWSTMVEMIDAAAPHGFLIYFKNDVRPVMVSAGDTADCVAYLMGNHVIAEKMFRHDPRAMLYAPLLSFGRTQQAMPGSPWTNPVPSSGALVFPRWKRSAKSSTASWPCS